MPAICRKQVRVQLAARREQLERALETALLEKQEPLAVSRLADALEAATIAERRLTRTRRHQSLFLLFVAIFVVSLLGIGVFVKLPIAPVHLNALATAVRVEAAGRGFVGSDLAPPLSNMNEFPVTSLEIEIASTEGDYRFIEHGGANIADIAVYGNTRMQLWYAEPGCVSAKVLEPGTAQEDTGVSLLLVPSDDGTAVYDRPERYFLGVGSVMRFCGRKDLRPFLFGSVVALSLIHEYQRDNLSSSTSSIVSGAVELLGTTGTRSLTPNDRVILDDLVGGWLALHRDEEAFRVAISGKAIAAQVKDNSPVNYRREDLIPNLVVFLTQSHTALLVGLAVSLFGMAWNAATILLGRTH